MVTGLYAVRDIAAQSYLAPFVAVNDAVAIRSFAFAFKDSGSAMAASPGDYELLRLADYDMVTGEIIVIDKFIVARGTDYAV